MAFRADISVDWGRSPRIITVAAPSASLVLQDLLDTLRTLEDDHENLDDKHLVDATGKGDLGSGLLVDLTLRLVNAQVAFASRTTAASVGTVTSGDANGTRLIDIGATFQSDGVVRGATVINFDDRSLATVLEVISQTELLHYPLVGGENDWDIGEAYKVFNVEQCEISGGNLLAVDAVGDAMSPLMTTANTQVLLARSSSGTSAGDITGAVWDSAAADHTTAGTFGEVTDLMRKFETNRLELAAGSTNNWILYDDDGMTPLVTRSVRDSSGNAIVIPAGTPARRLPGS